MSFFGGLLNPSRSSSKYNAAAMAYLDNAKKESIGYLQPYMEGGERGFNTLADLYGLSGQDAQANARAMFTTSPGYQFRFDQGVNAIDNAASARGMRNSGATLKALTKYGQGVASDEYGKFISGLQSLGGAGLASTGKAVDATTGAAQGIAGLLKATGEGKTNQSIGHGNMLGSLLGKAFSAFAGGAG
jgi:hypothetical protein